MATGLTPNYNLPYPLSTDPVNVAGDIEQLAETLDQNLTESIQDISSLMWTTGGTFSNGLQAPTYDDSSGKMSMSVSQDIRTSASPSFVGVTLTGDIAVNGGDVTTTSTTGTIFNSSATTINLGQGASVINIGSGSSQTELGGDLNVGSGKVYKINNASVLNSTTLGSSVINSSLTSVGTITSGVWNGTTIAVANGGTGVTSSTGTGSVVLSDSATLTGTPLAPTASSGTNTTQIATTQFVSTAISNVPNPNNGTLTLNTSGTGISGSQTFTANQSSDATFTVTIDSSSSATVNTVALRNATGGLSVISPVGDGSKGVREIVMSTTEPVGGLDGDVWLLYS